MNEGKMTLTNKMETFGNIWKPIFSCENCGINFKTKSGLWKHHQQQCTDTDSKNGNPRKPKFPVAISCKTCKKLYKTRSGLWKHARTCKPSEIDETCNVNDTKMVSQNMVISLLQQNKDMQALLIEQQKDHYESMHEKQQQINEMIPKMGNNNTTNKFNVNVFLSEKCKDAVNIADFVSSLQISLEDYDLTKDKGLLESVNHQIIKQLQQMEIYKRPIHCTDMKRDVMYIKDNDNWEKDENNDKLKIALGNIADKQIQHIGIWENANPTYMNSESGQEEYMNIVSSITQNIAIDSKSTNKVIKNIGKHVSITDMTMHN